MAQDKNKEESKDKKLGKPQRQNVLTDLLNKIAISVYGASSTNDIDDLDNKFNDIVKNQLDKINGDGSNALHSFLGVLYTNDKDTNKRMLAENVMDALQLNSVGANPQDMFTEQYRNRMTRQALASEISEILTELRFAKKIMSNAINSPDTLTGTISRKIVFENTTVDNAEKSYLPVVEAIEKKFDIKTKIRDFITPNLLGFGIYYVYVIPYHHLFNDFARRFKSGKDKYGVGVRFYESADDTDTNILDIIIHPLYEDAQDNTDDRLSKAIRRYGDAVKQEKFVFEEEYNYLVGYLDLKHEDDLNTVKSDLNELFTNRITISVSEIPVPILEDGIEAYQEFCEEYISEDGTYMEDDSRSKAGQALKTDEDVYLRKYGAGIIDDGIYQKEKDFDEFTEEDIKDCYMKMIPPTRMIPVKMMERTLFYIYIQTSPNTSLSTLLSYTTQMRTKDPNNKMDVLLDDIAGRVVAKFNKKFIKDNIDFRKEIVAALQYWDVSNTNIHFQIIPKEYVVEYAINKDVNGNGHSMMEGSIFYGNAYLSVLMFKLMSIFQNSNDRIVNYVRRSGIDKNLWDDVQDVIRRKNARKITLNDIFSYNNVVNKVGSGSEEFIGMTKNGDKPIESEVIQGQQIDLDTPLMERFRKNYILETGVPAAMTNYLEEVDFAKSIETAHAEMNSNTCAYQLCCNSGHTELYRKLLKFSTNVPDEVISTVNFVLQEPKGTSNGASQDQVNNYQTLQEFLLKLVAGDNPDEKDEARKRNFLIELAKIYLPGVDIDRVLKLWKDCAIGGVEANIVDTEDTLDDEIEI